MTDDVLHNQMIVEALRFGIVPMYEIENLTMGYSNLKNTFEQYLNNIKASNPQFLEVIGGFGTGKSHRMSVIRHIARNQNFITLKTEIDGSNISFHDPMGLWSALMETIEVKNKVDSVHPVSILGTASKKSSSGFEQLINTGAIYEAYTLYQSMAMKLHLERMNRVIPYFGALIAGDTKYTPTDLRKYIKQQSGLSNIPKITPIIRRSPVWERPNDFINGLAGLSFLAKMCGFNGIVITIDECEVNSHKLTTNQKTQLKDTLLVLINYFRGKLEVPLAPIGLFIANASDSRMDLVHMIVKMGEGNCEYLKDWQTSDYSILAKKITMVYEKAYHLNNIYNPEDASTAIKKQEKTVIQDGPVRKFIKDYISILDCKYGPSASNPNNIKF
ncbi:BREX system ATP-binding domain-containing protein [Methanospirillum sp.]|uniref:BREX system ATP-binding domain-containing protein n=1 Tax=Methanospirillum sp. TaxID=45200 RepID=UPI0035A106F2